MDKPAQKRGKIEALQDNCAENMVLWGNLTRYWKNSRTISSIFKKNALNRIMHGCD